MASRYVETLSGIQGPALAQEARLAFEACEGDPTVSIPKWLMVLAARGEVTLRVQLDLEDDPLGDDETISGD
ncbi:MAG TPA: hypothetical protein VEG84_00460 [Thermoanaerobaculia bacterium]|nr:hypothetical protein [Thermoanaerobaculia bacterium]